MTKYAIKINKVNVFECQLDKVLYLIFNIIFSLTESRLTRDKLLVIIWIRLIKVEITNLNADNISWAWFLEIINEIKVEKTGKYLF